MRTSRACIDSQIRILNNLLGTPPTAYTANAGKPLTANIGNLHIESNSPGDGVTRFQLAQMCSETGGISIVGNRTLLGSSNFSDYLRGVEEGILLARKGKQLQDILTRAVEYMLEAHDSELHDNHGGDADLPGEAPEVCSYCQLVADIREYMER